MDTRNYLVYFVFDMELLLSLLKLEKYEGRA